MMRRLHSLFGFAGSLGASRARRDAALLITAVAVIAASVALSIALPRLVLSAVDTGAQEAVADAGRDADIEIRTDVGTPRPQLNLVPPDKVVQLAEGLPALLPPTLARLYPDLYLTVLSPAAAVRPSGVDGGQRISLQLGMLTPSDSDTITLSEGALPSAPRDGERTEIDVVVSAGAADAASLQIGDVLEFTDANVDDIVAVVSGIVAPVEQSSPRWKDLPTLWSVTKSDVAVAFTALTNVEGMAAAEPLFANPVTATLRLVPEPTAFSSELIAPTIAQIGALRIDGSSLAGSSVADLVVRSNFDSALDEYPARARAAVAQMLVLIAGVLGVAAAVVMLLSRLVVARRAAELALERARGASLASIVIRSLLESLLVAAVGGVIGVALSRSLPANPGGIAVILAVGVLAAPVQSAVLIARADRSGRRTAANRGDRREVQRRGQARRLVVEAFIVVVAGAALFAVRSRGLLQTRTDGVDPLLAAAPLLLAIAVTVIVLRVYPVVVRFAMGLGRRTRGALGTLGAMQAERAIAVLPLASLTLAISLVVSGGLLVETVRSGQTDASWQRTGADVRVEGPVTTDEVAAVSAAPGVTAASGVLTVHESKVAVGAESALVTIVAVDPSFGEVLDRLPGDVDHDVSALFADSDPVPILIDESLARRLDGDVTLTIAGETREAVDARVVGTFDSGADGYDNGPFIYISREALTHQIAFTVETNEMLVMGPGAEQAVAQLGSTVFSRVEWLADRQHQALVSGVNTVMLVSTGAVAVLALIGLIASVLSGARTRRRALSLLRTLGMNARLGWWLALSELAPLVLAALIGGVAAGVTIIVTLGPSFGLETLAGGLQPPPLVIAPWVIAGVVVGVALLALVAMLAEVVAHRRDRLSDVLRVGESL